MVAKITAGNSLYGALAYNAEKIEEGKGKVLGANNLFYNRDGTFNLHDCMRDFSNYMPSHIATKKPILHISLNPHPDDKLSDVELSAIATEYIEKMGYGSQPFIIYKHEDIDRHHIHIVTLGVDSEGKKIDDGNNYYRSKKITRELEQKYGLLPAEKQKQKEVYRYQKVDPQQGDIKKQIASVLKPLVKNYHFLSVNEFRTLLSIYNIGMEEVKGEAKGRSYHGAVYFATDDKGKAIGNPIKSSRFGKTVGMETLIKKMEQSKVDMKEKRLGMTTRRIIENAKNRCRSLPQLEKELSKNGIDAIFRRNDTGRIYGATFIDHNCNCVINGSRMGKEFSANAFEQWANNPQPAHQNSMPQQPPQEQNIESYRNDFAEDTFSLGGLFDLPDNPAIDPDEERFRRQMQRKKRRQRRM